MQTWYKGGGSSIYIMNDLQTASRTYDQLYGPCVYINHTAISNLPIIFIFDVRVKFYLRIRFITDVVIQFFSITTTDSIFHVFQFSLY